jgi:ketosteroid isomerase-like protein
MTDDDREAMISVARAHIAAERARDIEATMATLDDDPCYELQPMGVILRGRNTARKYYEHFFAACQPRIRGSVLRFEWIADHSVVQEYALSIEDSDGTERRYDLIAILSFGSNGKLSGERLYASDELLRFMFGPLLP